MLAGLSAPVSEAGAPGEAQEKEDSSGKFLLLTMGAKLDLEAGQQLKPPWVGDSFPPALGLMRTSGRRTQGNDTV